MDNWVLEFWEELKNSDADLIKDVGEPRAAFLVVAAILKSLDKTRQEYAMMAAASFLAGIAAAAALAALYRLTRRRRDRRRSRERLQRHCSFDRAMHRSDAQVWR
jgi:hypothetical protein